MIQPETLEISTVVGCTNTCDYCPQQTLNKAYNVKSIKSVRKMTLDTFKTCIDKLPVGTWVDFSAFAEPFLNDQCTDMILYAHNRNHPIRLFTTLVGMTRQDIDRIKHIDFVKFLLHLPDNDGIMNAGIDDHYCDVFDYLLTHWRGGDAVCYGTLHGQLFLLIQKHALMVKMRDLDSQFLGTRANNVELKNTLQLEKNLREKGRLYCRPIFDKNDGPSGTFNHNILLPNADVVICCSDYGLKHKLGNLLVNDYDDLFKSHQYKKVMKGLVDESIDILCRTCEHTIRIG